MVYLQPYRFNRVGLSLSIAFAKQHFCKIFVRGRARKAFISRKLELSMDLLENRDITISINSTTSLQVFP